MKKSSTAIVSGTFPSLTNDKFLCATIAMPDGRTVWSGPPAVRTKKPHGLVKTSGVRLKLNVQARTHASR